LGLGFRMRLPWLMLALLWALVGCSETTRVVRLGTGWGSPVVHVPRSEETAGPIALDEDAVKEAVARLAGTLRPSRFPQEAARRLFEVEARSGSYLFDVRSGRITPLGTGERLAAELPQAEAELTHAYLRWCERTERKGDCLGLLKEGPSVTGDARFTLALFLAQGAVLDELWEAVKHMADPEAVMQAALCSPTSLVLQASPCASG